MKRRDIKKEAINCKFNVKPAKKSKTELRRRPNETLILQITLVQNQNTLFQTQISKTKTTRHHEQARTEAIYEKSSQSATFFYA